MIINYERCTFKSQKKRVFRKKKTLFNSKFDLNLKMVLMESYIWSAALCSVEN
jgi:hypothetical protein